MVNLFGLVRSLIFVFIGLFFWKYPNRDLTEP